jgi:pyruvate dehydrogenase E2 component (dihydrolipoamide acetyltransferase)
MEVGRVVEWLKQDGELVEAGDFLFLVETEKAVTEVEALDSGVLRIPPDAPAVGEDVEVGAMLAWIVPTGEAVPFEPGDGVGTVAAAASRQPTLEPVLSTGATVVGMASGPADNVTGGRVGRTARPAISPRARRAAEALGVDWTVLAGSGGSGRIVERDVLAAVR